MSTYFENSNSGSWSDFTVCADAKSPSVVDMYNSYILFKGLCEKLPKNELIRRGWIEEKNDLLSLSDFYKNVYAENGSKLFRKSNTADDSLISLWLSKVKSSAQIEVMGGSLPSFDGLSKKDLKKISKLSVDIDVIQKLPSILSKKGIVLIYSRAFPSMKLDGTVFKLESGNPVIGMSLRFSRLDNFWFTLVHELAHIHLHIDLLSDPIVEDLELVVDSEIEIAANRLAKNSFVDRVAWRNCEPKYDKGIKAIERFSNEVGIHKSIIAGMLRKETGDFAAYSGIVNEVNVRDLVFNDD